MIACSRPPPPTTRTLIAARRAWLQGLRELLGGNGGHGLVGGGAARAKLDRDLGYRLLVGRLDHAHEVVLTERGPLAEHLDAELLDLLVDLLDPSWIVLDGLHAVRGEPRQHDEYGHLVLLLVPLVSAYLARPPSMRRTSGPEIIKRARLRSTDPVRQPLLARLAALARLARVAVGLGG